MPEQLSGEALREAFFTTCLGWYPEYGNNDKSLTPYWVDADDNVYEWLPEVSTDANACEAWAMRWAREQGLRYTIDEYHDHVAVTLSHIECWHATARGTDYKQAFVRACVAAGEILKQAKGGT